jgi:hypothetical protein
LLALLLIATMQVLFISEATSLPVVVSSLSTSAVKVCDVALERNGTILYLSYDSHAVYRLSSSGSGVLLAGSGTGLFGAVDGVGSAARFYFPRGIVCDDSSRAYISDYYNDVIRLLDLDTNVVSTFAGSTSGVVDGVGSAAKFNGPIGIVYYSSGVLYVAEFDNFRIRKIVVDTVNVTTVANLSSNVWYLCINREGTVLFGTVGSSVVQVSTVNGSVITLAGAAVATGSADGVGSSASFTNPQGIELNGDESFLYLGDSNNRIRKLVLDTRMVTTVAGSGSGFADGPGASASFNSPRGATWFCNKSVAHCGLLVADYSNNAIRFVVVEKTFATNTVVPTPSNSHTASSPSTNSLSSTASPTFSGTESKSTTPTKSIFLLSHSASSPISSSVSRTGTVHTRTASNSRTITNSSSVTHSASRNASCTPTASTTMTASVSYSNSHSSAPSLSATGTASLSLSFSGSSSRRRSATDSASLTVSGTPSLRLPPTPTVTTTLTTSATTTATSSSSVTTTRTSTRSLCEVVDGSRPDDLFSRIEYDNATVTAVFYKRSLNVTTVLLSAAKSAALKQQGQLSVSLVLRNRVYLQRPLAGQRVALGTNSLSATASALSPSVVEIRLAASGSQYLGVAASLKLPLSALDGVCVVSSVGAAAVQVDFVLTPTVVTALDVMQSVGSVVGPLSAVSASPASAMAVTRLAILQALLSCDVDLTSNTGNSLLGLAIGPRTGAYMRGAVVGNTLIVVGFGAATAILVLCFLIYGRVVHGHAFYRTAELLQATFHVPGVLMLPIAAVCQPTLTACVQLVVLQPVEGDRVLGVLGMLVVVGLMMMPFTTVILAQFCLELTPEAESKAAATETSSSGGGRQSAAPAVCVPLRRLWRTLFGDRARWVPVAHDPGAAAWKKRYIPIFADCGTWWFPVADMWISAAVGVIGGLTLSNTNVCRGQLSVVGAAYLATLLLRLFVVKPLVLASKVYSVFIQLLGVVSCGAVTIALIQDEDQETVSVTVATYAMLLIALLSTLKSLTDLVALCIAFPVAMRKAYARVASLPSHDVVKDVPPDVTSPPDGASDDAATDVSLAKEVDDGSISEDPLEDDVGVEADPSIINGADAHVSAPVDYIRAAELKTLGDGGCLDFDEELDFIKLVFADGAAAPEGTANRDAAPTPALADSVAIDMAAALDVDRATTANEPAVEWRPLEESTPDVSMLLIATPASHVAVSPSSASNLLPPPLPLLATESPNDDAALDVDLRDDGLAAFTSRLGVSHSVSSDLLRAAAVAADDGCDTSGVLEPLGMSTLAL